MPQPLIFLGLCLLAFGHPAQAAKEVVAPDAVTADGARYYGPLLNGKLHGTGRLEWPDGTRYEGQFADGLISGKGRRQDVAGNTLEGQFLAGRLNGSGRMITLEGDMYEGTFLDGRLTGEGRYRGHDGAQYEGQFVDNHFHGQGRHSDPSGVVHEGNFIQGEFTGKGRLQGKEGWRYEGEVRDWQPHGQGVLHLANGDVYRGAFVEGLYDGEGVLIRATPNSEGLSEERGLWHAGVLESTAQARQLSTEAALYKQRALLDAALGALAPRDPNKINMYLLAIAGDGKSEVFRREADFVSEQFARRFAATGRTLTLVNSRRTATTRPMATQTSIEESLRAIAARMDKQRDILFVYLTSHGSKKHALVLDSDGMDLRDLTGADLARMLREADIRWKVVVVSACYSGGLIDALRDGATLIITAARHDRRSFGCASENDFTYFGRAFFKESLPLSESFEDAFQRAERLVRQWEQGKIPSQRQDEDYSLPQMVNPSAIQTRLRQWWAQYSSSQRSVSSIAR